MTASAFASPEAQTLGAMVRAMDLPEASHAMRDQLLQQYSESQAALALVTARSTSQALRDAEAEGASPAASPSQRGSRTGTPAPSWLGSSQDASWRGTSQDGSARTPARLTPASSRSLRSSSSELPELCEG